MKKSIKKCWNKIEIPMVIITVVFSLSIFSWPMIMSNVHIASLNQLPAPTIDNYEFNADGTITITIGALDTNSMYEVFSNHTENWTYSHSFQPTQGFESVTIEPVGSHGVFQVKRVRCMNKCAWKHPQPI